MELPDLGKHCSKSTCHKLDFLPIKCDACKQIFCDEHYSYANHNCKNAYRKDNQVPVCPLCNKPIAVGQGQHPDWVVGAHIDSDCQSDPARNKRKVFSNRCSLKGCKTKEVVPVVCNDCTENYCLKHRHPQDHRCQGKQGAARQRALSAALSRQIKSTSEPKNLQQNMTEDEALARAIAMSMEDTPTEKTLTQEELDLALARELQENEYQATQREASSTSHSRSNRDKCIVI